MDDSVIMNNACMFGLLEGYWLYVFYNGMFEDGYIGFALKRSFKCFLKMCLIYSAYGEATVAVSL
jgi:hypothetical protein